MINVNLHPNIQNLSPNFNIIYLLFEYDQFIYQQELLPQEKSKYQQISMQFQDIQNIYQLQISKKQNQQLNIKKILLLEERKTKEIGITIKVIILDDFENMQSLDFVVILTEFPETYKGKVNKVGMLIQKVQTKDKIYK
ncbi:hypothetical protein ABPG72_002428 [Tetrahymena utriculariae]